MTKHAAPYLLTTKVDGVIQYVSELRHIAPGTVVIKSINADRRKAIKLGLCMAEAYLDKIGIGWWLTDINTDE